MLEFSKRWGPVLLIAFISSVVGMVQVLIFLTDWLRILSVIILGILAIIFLVATIIAVRCDLKDAHKRDNPPPPGVRWLQ